EVDGSHPLAALLVSLQRESKYERIMLKGLSRVETADLVTTLTSHSFEERFVDRITNLTEGNPFFVRALIQRVVAEDVLRGPRGLARLDVPGSIRQVIGRRLAHVSPDANGLLTVASAFQGPFRYDVAAAVAEIEPAAALGVIDEALQAKLIEA